MVCPPPSVMERWFLNHSDELDMDYPIYKWVKQQTGVTKRHRFTGDDQQSCLYTIHIYIYMYLSCIITYVY